VKHQQQLAMAFFLDGDRLIVSGRDGQLPPMARFRLECLVDSLVILPSWTTELQLDHFTLISEPAPDGGLNVLRDFFARSDNTMTLTSISLDVCDFGSAEDAWHLFSAFHTNRTVAEMYIGPIANLDGAAFGTCLAGLFQNMPQLQRLDCTDCVLRVEGVRAFQPALQVNKTLKELILWDCSIGNDGFRLIADALVGGRNTTINLLDISSNQKLLMVWTISRGCSSRRNLSDQIQRYCRCL
jgi:hypothetical protein